MAKNASIILKLKDEFSGPLKVAAKGTKGFEKQTNLARKGVKHFANDLNNKFKTAVKASALAIGTLGAAAAKVGFSEAMDLEGYRMQLETATKDTKKAADIMKYAINLANKTPFEGGELVEGAAKFEAMGLSAKKWLTYAGDMAGATNKSFDQSVEALIDAQAGELERLKEFGITKRMIQDKADNMFKNEQVINNRGQIVNQKKFNEAMLALMNDKFAGGMEKQSKTIKGLWSTVTGVTKNAFANIVGMSNDGTVKAGSAFDLLKSKVKLLADTLQRWQDDGTIDRISEKVGKGITKAFDLASKAIKFLRDNMNWLKPVMIAVVAGFAAFSIITDVISMVQTLKTGINVLRVAFMGLNTATLGWTLAIGAVIVIVILLIKNWKKVIAWLGKLKDKFMSCGGPIGRFRDNIIRIVNAFKSVVSWIGKTIDKVKSFLGLNTKKTIEVETVDATVNTAFQSAAAGKKPTHHATGTTYFKGGLTGFSERGRTEEAIFPSGTRIIPADKAGKSLGEKRRNIIVNIIVQGNMIGNKRYMEETGNYIANRILAAMGNA